MQRPGPASFDRLLAPASVAVVGSLSSPEKVGARTVDHLRRAGYAGSVQAVGSVAELEGSVDVAVVAVPAKHTRGVLDDLRHRAGHAVVYSSGFSEAGEDELSDLHGGGMGLLGPNTVGLYVAASRTALAFAQALGPVIDSTAARTADPGGAALVTQSGAFGARICSAAAKRGIPLGAFIATGNEEGYTLPDVLEGIAGSAVISPRVVLVYLEAVRDGRRLAPAVRSLIEHGTEVLVLPGGRSSSGATAATSHTAALVGDAELLAEVLTAAGARVVSGDRELLDGFAALSLQAPVSGRRVGVLTGSGGAGVVAADLLAAAGLAVPPLGEDTRTELAELLPAFASTTNPVDVTASAIGDTAVLARCASTLAASGEIDVLLTVGRAPQAEAVQAAAGAVPAIVTVLDATTEDLRALAEKGVLASADLTTAASMAKVLTASVAPPPCAEPSPLAAAGSSRLTEPPSSSESLELAEQAGIAVAPWRRAATVDEAVRAGGELGWPVVVKADVGSHLHKAQVGAVRLDVTERNIAEVAGELLSATGSLIVAGQLRGGIELFAGARQDAQLGLVVVAGLGGGHVELLGRTVSVPADAPRAWISRRIDEVAFHCRAPSGLPERLADVALRLAGLVHDTGADAAECNPLIDTIPGLMALDARVVLS